MLQKCFVWFLSDCASVKSRVQSVASAEHGNDLGIKVSPEFVLKTPSRDVVSTMFSLWQRGAVFLGNMPCVVSVCTQSRRNRGSKRAQKLVGVQFDQSKGLISAMSKEHSFTGTK